MTPTAHAASDPDHGAREALRLLGPLPEDWVPRREGIDHNVVLVGGGQNGCAYAFALRRAGIGQVAVIDAAPDAASAGLWLQRARMLRLRTPKNLVGPELDVTALGFQAWYEVRHGRAAYAALERIPRTAWADYLTWFRQFLDIDVRYGTRLERIEPVVDAKVAHLRLHLRVNGQARTETTRKLVLANGVAGNGAPVLPPGLESAVAAGLAAHTHDTIDFSALHGQTVAVVGAAASAFDAAAVALEAGASAVHLFARRDHIAARPVAKPRAYPGMYDHFPSLPDALRWRQALRYRRAGSTPPADAISRVMAYANFHLHLNAPWTQAAVQDHQVQTTLNGEAFSFDFVIAGTGYSHDPAERPELADLAPLVLRWRDLYTPAAGEEDALLGAAPYLGQGQQYLEKTPGTAAWLGLIHVHNPAGFVSRGLPLGDVPSMRRDIPNVVHHIGRDLLIADLDLHARRIGVDVAAEFGESLYAEALWQGLR